MAEEQLPMDAITIGRTVDVTATADLPRAAVRKNLVDLTPIVLLREKREPLLCGGASPAMGPVLIAMGMGSAASDLECTGNFCWSAVSLHTYRGLGR